MSERPAPDTPAGGTPNGSIPWRPLGWTLAGALLLTPLLAMQFTEEVLWTPGDFIVFGLMLAVAGGCLELAVRSSGQVAYRLGTALTVLGGFLLLWVNLAVGIIGNEENPANLLFGGIIAILVLGTVMTRGQAVGMARTLWVAAMAQIVIALLTALLGLGNIFVISAVFTGFWLAAAWSFRRSAAVQPRPGDSGLS